MKINFIPVFILWTDVQNWTLQIVASELNDPICHSNECQIESFSAEATKLLCIILGMHYIGYYTYLGQNDSCKRHAIAPGEVLRSLV